MTHAATERDDTAPSLEQVREQAMAFLTTEVRFAQVFTVNRAGFPVGRTMGAPVNSDWSVDLLQRRVLGRVRQMQADPHVEIVWSGAPAKPSERAVPRTVFLRGTAEFLDDEAAVAQYRQFIARIGGGEGPGPARRDDDEVRRELVAVHVRPVRVRAEGFGVGAQAFSWQVGPTSG